jgi:Rad3-related DNA helicase
VSYLLNELHQWNWYYQTAGIHIQQSVGRAVRGPEPSEAASYYVVDSKFGDVMFNRTTPPEWFTEAITQDAPEHWENPDAAPWR